MAKGKMTKERQYHGQRGSWYCLSFVSFPLAMIFSVFCQFPFGHDIVCLLSVSLWPWYCLSFVSFSLGQYHGPKKTDKRQTISWPKVKWKKIYNIMAKGKILSIFCHFTFDHDIVCHLSVSLRPWYCLFFCQLPLGHDIVSLLSVSLWPWYKRETISWPKGNWQKTDNIMAKGKLTKDRQYHGPRKTDKRQTRSWPKGNCLLSVSLWPWYCLSFITSPLAMIFAVFCLFPFGHDIVCLLSVSLWPW
jgi:uncharacterized membrane protein YccF (DUF307 family)